MIQLSLVCQPSLFLCEPLCSALPPLQFSKLVSKIFLCSALDHWVVHGNFFIFVDDRSRCTWVYFIRSKGDVFEYFKEFRNMIEKQSGKCIKILRSANGGEYVSESFKRYCKDHIIQQPFIVPYTPQQNEVSERKNRTMVECACNMLQGKIFPMVFEVKSLILLFI